MQGSGGYRKESVRSVKGGYVSVLFGTKSQPFLSSTGAPAIAFNIS